MCSDKTLQLFAPSRWFVLREPHHELLRVGLVNGDPGFGKTTCRGDISGLGELLGGLNTTSLQTLARLEWLNSATSAS